MWKFLPNIMTSSTLTTPTKLIQPYLSKGRQQLHYWAKLVPLHGVSMQTATNIMLPMIYTCCGSLKLAIVTEATHKIRGNSLIQAFPEYARLCLPSHLWVVHNKHLTKSPIPPLGVHWIPQSKPKPSKSLYCTDQPNWETIHNDNSLH